MASHDNSLISIIMPIRHATPYLQKAINSITQQTYSNFEFIIVDDDIDPATHQQLKKQNDKRICIIKNKNTQGIPGALNTGIQYANGQYIARMDADDISYPTRLKKQLNYLKSTQCEICGTWLKTKHYHFLPGKVFHYPDNIEDIYFSLLYGTAIAHPTIMATKELMQYYSYNTQYPVASDYDLWNRMAVDNINISNLNEVMYEYRIHSNQISETKRLKQEAISMQVADNYAKKYLPHNLYSESTKLNHGRNLSYSLNDAYMLAKLVLQFAEKKNISSATKTSFSLKLAYRLKPLSMKNIRFIETLSSDFNLSIARTQKLTLLIQNSCKIERHNNLYQKLKWVA